MQPRSVSVIVSAYQQRRTLEWLLSGLAAQDTSWPWELLVCDDGSSVDVLGVVREWHDRIKGEIRYIWQRDDGFRLSRSRNNGIRCAEGDLLVFLDADVVIRPDFLSRHLELHIEDRQIVCGPVTSGTVDPETSLEDLMASLEPDAIRESPSAQVQRGWFESEHQWVACPGANVSFRRTPEARYEEGFVEWGSEDRELAYRLVVKHGYRVVYADRAPILHVSLRGEQTPRLRRSHEDIVAVLRNKLHFRALHPEMDVEVGLGLLRHCFLDPQTDKWSIREPQEGRTARDVLALAEKWLADHGLTMTSHINVPRDIRY